MRMVMAGVAIVAALTAGAAGAQYGARAPLGEQDNGRVITVPRGTVLYVRLQQAGGTNYLWRMVRNRNAVLIGPPTTSVQPTQPGIVGGPQLRVFAVRIIGSGRFPLAFRLAPNILADDTEPTRTVTYVIDTGRD